MNEHFARMIYFPKAWELVKPAVPIRILHADEIPDDPYYVQLGISQVFSSVAQDDEVLYLDCDHLLYEPARSSDLRSDSRILVSSEFTALPSPTAELNAHCNTSLLFGRARVLSRVGALWREPYEHIRYKVGSRHRTEIAFSLASARACVTLQPCDGALQSNFAVSAPKPACFHYGGESIDAVLMTTKLMDIAQNVLALDAEQVEVPAYELQPLLELWRILIRNEVICDRDPLHSLRGRAQAWLSCTDAILDARCGATWPSWKRECSSTFSCASRAMARRTGASGSWLRSWACRRSHEIRPHRLRQHMVSNDPDFEAKAADAIELYLTCPRTRWCTASTRRQRFRRLIARIGCCRWRRDVLKAMASNTNATQRPQWRPPRPRIREGHEDQATHLADFQAGFESSKHQPESDLAARRCMEKSKENPSD